MADVPYNIFNARSEQCVRCPTPCEFQKDEAFRTSGDNACPIGKWMDYKLYVRNKAGMRGLGDAVAFLAEPIAGALDATVGTKLKGCSACAKRKEMLNQLLPFGKNIPPYV